MTHDNRGRLTVDTAGKWRLYVTTLPEGAEALGTVTRDIGDTGALLRMPTGRYVQANAGALRSLDGRKVAAALGLMGGARTGAGRPALSEDGEARSVSIWMTAAQAAKLEALGGAAWVRQRIDRAKVTETPQDRAGAAQSQSV